MNTTILKHKPLANGAIYVKTIPSSEIIKGRLIDPSTQKTTKPLAPAAPERIFINKDAISIPISVSIDANYEVESLDIYKNPMYEIVEGNMVIKTLPIYIVYNYKEEIPTSLYPYTFKLNIFNIPEDLNVIETFLYDKDPVTSSGTKTTVKRGFPGN